METPQWHKYPQSSPLKGGIYWVYVNSLFVVVDTYDLAEKKFNLMKKKPNCDAKIDITHFQEMVIPEPPKKTPKRKHPDVLN